MEWYGNVRPIKLASSDGQKFELVSPGERGWIVFFGRKICFL